ncbi:putative acetyltransferase [Andreprevotia lacus DSM 23236]|jgi:putative acetyltransferase|uniref:Putative acetyltransferase n=1 Tax=Andreprevotia lacus DSM 23236 TaxID=1121001 RepID=A0A1W1X8S6_9NEIS|nr:GNAT family N-acetyltransferase [Andreprevotia lacus]SMC20329.1 putative acetyltransferase [Andreprevotia lacus DSM 23236]
MEIRTDDLSHPAVHALLREHLAGMQANSPPGAVYALDLAALRAPAITFWTAWDGDALLGCGALKTLDARHGEIKSMRTASPHLRRGVAQALLDTVIRHARTSGLQRLSLETGSAPAFQPAIALYQRNGFERSGPFGDYRDNGFSVFMTRSLA